MSVAGKPVHGRNGASRVALAAAVSIAWMVCSSALILVNKHILVGLKFPFPMTVSALGMAASSICSYLACRVLRIVEANASVSPGFWVKHMLPIGFMMAMTLWTGNLVYLYLSVSFIQMLKAFTPVITMLALFMVGLEKPNSPMIFSVLIIAAGTAASAYGEATLNAAGIFFMFASEITEAARLVATQYLLVGAGGLQLSPIEGVMYLSPACVFWLGLGAMFLEFPSIRAAGVAGVPAANGRLFFVAAMLGFCINMLAYMTIQLASSLTLKVLATVKNALIIVAAMAIWGEVVTGLQAVGYLASAAAFVLYTVLKMRQVAAG